MAKPKTEDSFLQQTKKRKFDGFLTYDRIEIGECFKNPLVDSEKGINRWAEKRDDDESVCARLCREAANNG